MTESTILLGDCREALKDIEPESVQTCITSPPYFGLRDYGTGDWEGGDADCDHMRTNKVGKDTATGHKAMGDKGEAVGDAIYKSTCPKCGAIRKDDQIGLEQTPEEFVTQLVQVFREVKRVLRDDGTLWLNLGDTYVSTAQGSVNAPQEIRGDNKNINVQYRPKIEGLKSKDMIGIPWRVAFALQADGWYLRQDIIWHKPNPMPESVTDRCTKSHEYIFLLSKSQKYFYDYEAIKERQSTVSIARAKRGVSDDNKWTDGADGQTPHSLSQKRSNDKSREVSELRNKRSVWTVTTKPYKDAHFATFPKKLIEPCILAGSNKGDTVLDPFTGAGTTGLVSVEHGRNFLGCELNPEYRKMAMGRIHNAQPYLI